MGSHDRSVEEILKWMHTLEPSREACRSAVSVSFVSWPRQKEQFLKFGISFCVKYNAKNPVSGTTPELG
jgi:hypothetical protein